MATVKLLWISLVLGLVAMAVGCGAGKDLHDVSGRVTLDGKPLAGVIVHFVPEAGPAASSQTDSMGWYVIRTAGHGDGASLGRQRVWFESPPEAEDNYSDSEKYPRFTRPAILIPDRYQNPATSNVTVTVLRGTNTRDFVLVSSAPP